MAFNDIKRQSGRIACTIFEIDLDINDPSLDAEFAANPSSYGTPKTTNDVRAWLDGSVRTYRYSDQYIANLDCFPNLRSAKSNPPKANPGIDIGFRATASIDIDDFETNDAYEVQGLYADRRVTGSHFAKLFARNFVKNRPARIKRGYLVDGVYDEANFQIEHYIIDQYQGPTLSGRADFDLVDVLALTNGINAKAPETTNATLNAAIDSAVTTITANLESGLSAADIEAKFGANGATGYLAIGNEYMGYTVTSATGVAPVVMTVDRAEYGTAPSEHSVNATVQRAIAWDGANIITILDDLFRNHTDIDETYIPAAEWAALAAGELSLFELTNIITKETEVKKLINELIQIAGLTMYVDVVERAIKIVATPNFDTPVITFDSVEHYEIGTLKVMNDFDRLVTRQLVRWAPRDYSNTEDNNWTKTFRVAAILEELPDRLGVKSDGKEVISRWLPNTVNGNQIATGIAQRNVARFSQVPQRVAFEVDSKYVGTLENSQRMWIGSVFSAITPAKVFCNGAFQSQILTCQCTSVSAGRRPDKWMIEGVSYQANIPPNADYYIAPGEYLDYVLSDEFDFSATGVEFIVVVSSGAVFGSTSAATAGFRQGTFGAGSTLRLIMQGQAFGKGGNGGNGGAADYESAVCSIFNGTAGGNAGPACEFTTDAIIDNSFGLIAGGGGGSAGLPGQCLESSAKAGDGGGGGQGFVAGNGGNAGIAGVSTEAGADGQDATLNYPGLYGGALGQAGTSVVGISGATISGGAAGAAIITNGNAITITAGNNSEQIKGAIV
jgi:hypothetical protein